jgi:hypothetical protein
MKRLLKPLWRARPWLAVGEIIAQAVSSIQRAISKARREVALSMARNFLVASKRRMSQNTNCAGNLRIGPMWSDRKEYGATRAEVESAGTERGVMIERLREIVRVVARTRNSLNVIDRERGIWYNIMG